MGQDFAGKTVLVSGGARGQGASHSRAFAAEGAKVLLGDIRDELGEETAQSIRDAALTGPPTAVRPPSVTYCPPVMLAARSEHRNSTRLATSAAVP